MCSLPSAPRDWRRPVRREILFLKSRAERCVVRLKKRMTVVYCKLRTKKEGQLLRTGDSLATVQYSSCEIEYHNSNEFNEKRELTIWEKQNKLLEDNITTRLCLHRFELLSAYRNNRPEIVMKKITESREILNKLGKFIGSCEKSIIFTHKGNGCSFKVSADTGDLQMEKEKNYNSIDQDGKFELDGKCHGHDNCSNFHQNYTSSDFKKMEKSCKVNFEYFPGSVVVKSRDFSNCCANAKIRTVDGFCDLDGCESVNENEKNDHEYLEENIDNSRGCQGRFESGTECDANEENASIVTRAPSATSVSTEITTGENLPCIEDSKMQFAEDRVIEKIDEDHVFEEDCRCEISEEIGCKNMDGSIKKSTLKNAQVSLPPSSDTIRNLENGTPSCVPIYALKRSLSFDENSKWFSKPSFRDHGMKFTDSKESLSQDYQGELDDYQMEDQCYGKTQVDCKSFPNGGPCIDSEGYDWKMPCSDCNGQSSSSGGGNSKDTSTSTKDQSSAGLSSQTSGNSAVGSQGNGAEDSGDDDDPNHPRRNDNGRIGGCDNDNNDPELIRKRKLTDRGNQGSPENDAQRGCRRNQTHGPSNITPGTSRIHDNIQGQDFRGGLHPTQMLSFQKETKSQLFPPNENNVLPSSPAGDIRQEFDWNPSEIQHVGPHESSVPSPSQKLEDLQNRDIFVGNVPQTPIKKQEISSVDELLPRHGLGGGRRNTPLDHRTTSGLDTSDMPRSLHQRDDDSDRAETSISSTLPENVRPSEQLRKHWDPGDAILSQAPTNPSIGDKCTSGPEFQLGTQSSDGAQSENRNSQPINSSPNRTETVSEPQLRDPVSQQIVHGLERNIRRGVSPPGQEPFDLRALTDNRNGDQISLENNTVPMINIDDFNQRENIAVPRRNANTLDWNNRSLSPSGREPFDLRTLTENGYVNQVGPENNSVPAININDLYQLENIAASQQREHASGGNIERSESFTYQDHLIGLFFDPGFNHDHRNNGNETRQDIQQGPLEAQLDIPSYDLSSYNVSPFEIQDATEIEDSEESRRRMRRSPENHAGGNNPELVGRTSSVPQQRPVSNQDRMNAFSTQPPNLNDVGAGSSTQEGGVTRIELVGHTPSVPQQRTVSNQDRMNAFSTQPLNLNNVGAGSSTQEGSVTQIELVGHTPSVPQQRPVSNQDRMNAFSTQPPNLNDVATGSSTQEGGVTRIENVVRTSTRNTDGDGYTVVTALSRYDPVQREENGRCLLINGQIQRFFKNGFQTETMQNHQCQRHEARRHRTMEHPAGFYDRLSWRCGECGGIVISSEFRSISCPVCHLYFCEPECREKHRCRMSESGGNHKKAFNDDDGPDRDPGRGSHRQVAPQSDELPMVAPCA